MPDPDVTEGAETVPCDVCMKEVPAADAKIEEVDDYVRHFCGLDCYKKWQEEANKEQES